MKRILSFLMALWMALFLCACGELPEDLISSSDGPSFGESDVISQLPASESPTEGPESSPPSEEPENEPEEPQESETVEPSVTEDGWYNSKDEVALYVHLYGHLPDNYVTKKEAQDMGWTGGSVERYAGEGTAIGGSRFGNYEGLLPDAKGRTFTECDIDTVGETSRGAKRIIFSNDGLIYYTEDHYESFELLYGEP